MAQEKLSLTNVSIFSKKALVVAGILLLVFIAIYNSIPTIKKFSAILFPEKIEAPVTIYGQLPALKIPGLTIKGSPLFEIETPTGQLPSFPAQAPVLLMENPEYSYLSGERARNTASLLGFKGEHIRSESGGIQIWSDAEKQATLSFNLVTGSFEMDRNIDAVLNDYIEGVAVNAAEATAFVSNILNKLSPKPPEEYITGKMSVQYIRYGVNREVMHFDTPFQAQITRVDVFRSIADTQQQKIPIVTDNPDNGLISFWLIRNKENTISIVKARYYSWRIKQTERIATYPLRSIGEAWQEVIDKKVAIVTLRESKDNPERTVCAEEIARVDIHRVYLAYYDSPQFNQFLQPLYVFEGVGLTTNRSRQVIFIAYAGAVSSEWYSESK